MEKEKICCPTCNKQGTWTPDNASRPFCSPRCKLIDLGAWAEEEHRIPGEPVIPEEGADLKDHSKED
jgi:endogenous inhibitor of DNA gyrase (YacG/DUF329 family)